MSKIIGRLVAIGLGKETTRGTSVAPGFWIPNMSLTHDDKIQQVVSDQSQAIIEDATEANITQTYSEGEIKGIVHDDSLGLILLATLGASTPVAVAGQAGAFDHTITVAQNVTHPSLTIGYKDANSGIGLTFPLGMIDSFEFNAELNKYVEFGIKYRAQAKVTTALTPSYLTTSNKFLPQHGVVKFATNLAGLGAAPAISVKRASFTISKNIEDDQVLGAVAATDRLNKAMSIEGSIELMYNDRVYIDTNMLGDLAQALRIEFINTGKTIGVSTNPSIQFNFAKTKLREVARSIDNDNYVLQTLNFKALYSIADAQMIGAVLRNVTASY